jgi:hypothetical protein
VANRRGRSPVDRTGCERFVLPTYRQAERVEKKAAEQRELFG